GCALLVSQCGTLCSHDPTENRRCAVAECLAADASSVAEAGPLTLDCATGGPQCGAGGGRRARGRVAKGARRAAGGAGGAPAGGVEAASGQAFRRLERDLASLGAPRALVRAARRAAEDEIRHARVTSRLARRRGAAASPVVLAENAGAKSLAEVAMENAVEGC